MQSSRNKEVHMARTPIHPGETLREDLEELGMSAAELSRQLAVPVNRITQILNGSRAVTGDTALRLGHFFNTSPEFWLNLQKLYDLRMAEQTKGDEVARLPKFDANAWQKRGKTGHVGWLMGRDGAVN
jgi:addiction module HigA family antidote